MLAHDDKLTARRDDRQARYKREREGGGSGCEASASNHFLGSPSTDRISNRPQVLAPHPFKDASSYGLICCRLPVYLSVRPYAANQLGKAQSSKPIIDKAQRAQHQALACLSAGQGDGHQFAASKRRAMSQQAHLLRITSTRVEAARLCQKVISCVTPASLIRASGTVRCRV